MKGTNLVREKMPLPARAIYTGVAVLIVASGILLMYRHLWQAFGRPVAKTIAREVYVEATTVACRTNADCSTACNSMLGAVSEGCVCAAGFCRYVSNMNQFAPSKFCEQDSDCVISCYEGPVNRVYFDQAGGAKVDCSDGCKSPELLVTRGKPNWVTCRHNQCQYQDGRSCFVREMLQAGISL